MTAVPARSADAIEIDLGGDLMLVAFETRRLHTLNRTAAAAWRAIDGHRDLDELVRMLADAHGVGPAAIRGDIAELVARLEQGRLIGDGSEIEDPSPARKPALSMVDVSTSNVVGPFSALDWAFVVGADDPAIADRVETALEPLVTLRRPESGVEILGSAGGYRISVDGEAAATAADASGVLDQVVALANQRAVEATCGAVALHAGGVATGHGVVALPAPSNRGKSTLVAHLVRNGLDYLSDEAVAIEVGTVIARPYHKPISLDPGSFPLFPEAGPPPDTGRWHLDPRALGTGELSPGGALSAVVVPRRVEHDRPSLRPLTPDEAFRILLENAFTFHHVGHAAVTTLAGVASSVPAFELIHGGIECRGTEVVELVAEAASR